MTQLRPRDADDDLSPRTPLPPALLALLIVVVAGLDALIIWRTGEVDGAVTLTLLFFAALGIRAVLPPGGN